MESLIPPEFEQAALLAASLMARELKAIASVAFLALLGRRPYAATHHFETGPNSLAGGQPLTVRRAV